MFKSWQSYQSFKRSVLSKSRYVLGKEDKAFIKTLIESCKQRKIVLERGINLWRVQSGHDYEEYYQDNIYIDDIACPYPSKRMKPPHNKAKEGRLNPKGIPALYLSTDERTALLEMRPWKGETYSVGIFKTISKLKLANFVSDGFRSIFYFEEPSEDKIYEAVINDVDRAFSTPVTPQDDVAEYATTQIIAEHIKKKGYHGIIYHSSVGKGNNVALFNLDDAELVKCSLYETTDVDPFSFKEIANPYFLVRNLR